VFYFAYCATAETKKFVDSASSSFNSLKATIEQVQVQAVARDNRKHKARKLALTVALDYKFYKL